MGELTKKFTEKVQDLKDTAKYLFDRTSIEVAILTVLGLGS
jgi:hypothetical protein